MRFEQIAVAANAAPWGEAANPFRSGGGDRRQAMQWQRYMVRNKGEPGKRAKGRRAPELAALQENGDAERGTTYRAND